MQEPDDVCESRKPRVLKHKTPEVRARVLYVCDVLFEGNVAKFSNALHLNYLHVYKALYVSARITISMLAQIVSRLPIRAEWLLTGTGPMLVNKANRVESAFYFPGSISSSFPLFKTKNVLHTTANTINLNSPKHKIDVTDPIHGARAIHACRIAGKPVCFFLGADAFNSQDAADCMHEYVDRGYLTSLAMTAACIPRDLGIMHNPVKLDINYISRLAAVRGTSLAEALGSWATTASGKKPSLLGTLLNRRIPVTVHVEFGELTAHLQPSLCGAEIGAAIGAASYVDLLVLAEQVRRFSTQGGGIFVILGEPNRWKRLIRSTLHAVKSSPDGAGLNEFSILTVPHPYADASAALLHACTGVFDGTRA